MAVISFLNQKGGVGKTTLAGNISSALVERGASVLLVDSDPQGSTITWARAREGELIFPTVGIAKQTLNDEVKFHAALYDFVVIDGPPGTSELPRSAIVASDMIFVPVTPSSHDVAASAATIELVRQVTVISEKKRFCAFVINRKKANTVIGKKLRDALATYSTHIMTTEIGDRTVLAESAGSGMTALDAEADGKAAAEIRALAEEIILKARELGLYE